MQKIEFTEEQQQEINTLLERKPSKYTKYHPPLRREYIMKKLKAKYYGNCCCLCAKLPEYRARYNMNGAFLIENYCQEHFKQCFPNES